MVDPHVCADGHSYEHDAISAWLGRHDTSPQTNLPLAHKHLVPNITLRNAIIAFQSRAEVPAPVAAEPAPAPGAAPVPEQGEVAEPAPEPTEPAEPVPAQT